MYVVTAYLLLLGSFPRSCNSFGLVLKFGRPSSTTSVAMASAAHEEDNKETMFDLIVGDKFNDPTSEVEEVGGDPWFLSEDDDE